MVTKIDILGIRNKRLDTNDNVQMESLDEYLDVARKIISSYGSKIRHGLAEEMLRNEDAIANIAHAIMMADWQFNGNGSIYGFRKERAKFAIKSYISRRVKENEKRVFELDNTIGGDSDAATFADLVEDPHEPPDVVVAEQEVGKKVVNKIQDLVNVGLITESGANCVRRYYVDGLSMPEIARERGITRQRVEQILKKSMGTIKEHIKQEDYTGV